MAAGDNSALGTLVLKDNAGQKPAQPVYVDRVLIPGDADYATGGTGPTTAGGTGGLVAALRTLMGDKRTILAAFCSGQRAVTTHAANTNWIECHYDVLHDKIQYYQSDDADAAGSDELSAGDHNLDDIDFEWTIFSY
jgi:hypothetical protein